MTNGTTSDMAPQSTVIESQIDWLTAGWNEGPKADRAEAWAFSRAQRERREGADEKPFSLLGFSGWTVGRVRFGRRSGDALLQLSGDLAEVYGDMVVAEADRVSRVDVAVTVRLSLEDLFLGETTYAQAVTHREEHPKSALPWIVQDGDGGCTTYVGHRSSDRFLRVYNKQAEAAASGDQDSARRYANCWRYELECKGTVAFPMAVAVVGAADRPAFIQQQLHDYTVKHGILPAFGPSGNRVLIPGFRRRSDYQTRLTWLRSSVNPAILTMLEVGDRAEIMDALGLAAIRET